MRISDWSSDVCSSDLELAARQRRRHADDADIGAFGQRIDRLPVGIDARAQRLEILDAAYVVLERERGDLGRVDDRSAADRDDQVRSEEHTSELQSLMRISYAVFCLKNTKTNTTHN